MDSVKKLKRKINRDFSGWKDWFKKSTPEKDNYIRSKEFLSKGIWGGAIAGLIIGMFVKVLKKKVGFEGKAIEENFGRLYPTMLFCAITMGGIAGWLSCRYIVVANKNDQHLKIRRFREFSIFIYGFIALALVHQLPSRYALVLPDSKPIYYEKINDTLRHGGPLGEPDFETIATGFFGGIAFLILVKGLSKGKIGRKDDYSAVVRATVLGVVIYGFIYFVYRVLTGFGIFIEGSIPFNSRSIFVIQFPHPERIIYFALFCLIYGFGFIYSVTSSQIFLKFIGMQDNKFYVELIFPRIYDDYTKLPIRDHCHEVLLKFAVKRIHDEEKGGYLKENEFYAQTYLSRIAKEELKINRKRLFEKKGQEYRISIPAEQIMINYEELEQFPKLKEILKADWCKG